MKIIYKSGDALSGLELHLAHGCNNRGVMGSGIAKQIRKKYPKAYDFYRWNYVRSGLTLGENYSISCSSSKRIHNCITQDGFGRDGKQYVSYEAVESCIKQISADTSYWGYLPVEVAMPMIGAGLGGGNWDIIEEIIEKHSTFQPVVYTL